MSSSRPPQSSEPMPSAARPPTPPRDTSYDLDMDVIDMIMLEERKHFRRDANQTTPIALAASGYLTTTPVEPTLAISFTTLEYFRRLRSRKSSYSVEAFAKVLCDLYAVGRDSRMRDGVVADGMLDSVPPAVPHSR